jgi:hypothetical protein
VIVLPIMQSEQPSELLSVEPLFNGTILSET